MVELEYYAQKLLLEAATGSNSGVKCRLTVLAVVAKRLFVGACLDQLWDIIADLALYWQQRGDGYTPIAGYQHSHMYWVIGDSFLTSSQQQF